MLKRVLVLGLAMMVVGCAVTPVAPPRGALYNDQRAPMFDGKETGTKMGEAKAITGYQFPVQPPSGFIYTSYKAPLFCDTAEGPVLRADNLKAGTAEASNLILYYQFLSFGWGDISIEAAARNAGISRIHFADYELLSILGLYNRATIRVCGE